MMPSNAMRYRRIAVNHYEFDDKGRLVKLGQKPKPKPSNKLG